MKTSAKIRAVKAEADDLKFAMNRLAHLVVELQQILAEASAQNDTTGECNSAVSQ